MKQRLLAIILGILLGWPLFALAGYMDQPQLGIPTVVGNYLQAKSDELGGIKTTILRICPPMASQCSAIVHFRDPKVLGGKGMEGAVGRGTFKVDSYGTLGPLMMFEWPDGKMWERGIGIQKLPDNLT